MIRITEHDDIFCDGCGHPVQDFFTNKPYIVINIAGQSGTIAPRGKFSHYTRIISSGQHHFCSKKCIFIFLDKIVMDPTEMFATPTPNVVRSSPVSVVEKSTTIIETKAETPISPLVPISPNVSEDPVRQAVEAAEEIVAAVPTKQLTHAVNDQTLDYNNVSIFTGLCGKRRISITRRNDTSPQCLVCKFELEKSKNDNSNS